MLHRFMLLMGMAVLLAACSEGEPFKEAYTAKGAPEASIASLEKTSTFSTTEEQIQLVLKFDQRTESLPMVLNWEGPDDSFDDDLEVIVPADTESFVIGLNLAQSGRSYWTPGEWKVKIRLDGKAVDEVAFNVEGDIPEGAEATEEAPAAEDAVENPTNPFGSPQATPTFSVDQPSNPFGGN